jgi:hypothetical protein
MHNGKAPEPSPAEKLEWALHKLSKQLDQLNCNLVRVNQVLVALAAVITQTRQGD